MAVTKFPGGVASGCGASEATIASASAGTGGTFKGVLLYTVDNL
jgi:hypothetical protein